MIQFMCLACSGSSLSSEITIMIRHCTVCDAPNFKICNCDMWFTLVRRNKCKFVFALHIVAKSTLWAMFNQCNHSVSLTLRLYSMLLESRQRFKKTNDYFTWLDSVFQLIMLIVSWQIAQLMRVIDWTRQELKYEGRLQCAVQYRYIHVNVW